MSGRPAMWFGIDQAAVTTPISVKLHVQHPVHGLDAPMRANRPQRLCRIFRQGRDKEPRFHYRLAGFLEVGFGLDHAAAFQAWPFALVGKPSVMEYCGALPQGYASHHIAAQLLRSATSVAG